MHTKKLICNVIQTDLLAVSYSTTESFRASPCSPSHADSYMVLLSTCVL